MATQEDIERLFALFCEAHPQDSLREMDKTSAGQGAVLRYLASVEEPVTSGQIAQALGGSTARMAVLLKKLEARGSSAARLAKTTRAQRWCGCRKRAGKR